MKRELITRLFLVPVLVIANVDFWYIPAESVPTLYYANTILHHWLGITKFQGMSFVSLTLFYFLPINTLLNYAKDGFRWSNFYDFIDYPGWILMGLVLPIGLAFIFLFLIIGPLVGMHGEVHWMMLAGFVALWQIAFYQYFLGKMA